MARNSIAPGGYIGGEPPRRPMLNQLSGVWKLDDAMERQRAGTWANPLGIEDLFSTYLYTGNGATQTITNGIDLSGKGGLVWTKARSAAYNHILVDTVRGRPNSLFSNATNAQGTASDISSFSSTGYALGLNQGYENNSGITYASWTFRKAAKFFDVVTFTASSSGALTVNHNLGAVPGTIIFKSSSGTSPWYVWHRSIPNNCLALNLTEATSFFAAEYAFGNGSSVVQPTSTQFTVYGNAGNTYVAYLFAHDAGGFGDSGNESVVKCGSFTGTGPAGGQLESLGWEPQWLLVKRTDSTGDWEIYDSMRGFVNDGSQINTGDDARLKANLSNAEDSFYLGWPTATGFQYDRSGTYVYIAIRRGPMKTPTVGTSVFDAETSASATGTAITTGFPIDLQIAHYRAATFGTVWADRLRGVITSPTNATSATLISSDTTAEATSLFATRYWNNTGFEMPTGWAGNSTIFWNFRRAPGFFDVVAYTGTGVARTVSHNLGVVPELMIVKSRTTSGYEWDVYSATVGNQGFLTLNSANAANTGISSLMWNSTTPTSSVFSLGTWSDVNASGNNFIAYLFASCPGVSKVGSYTGTGTTLNIDCGFSNGARFVLIKRTDNTGDWYVWDTARGIIAANDPYLLLNSTAAEVTNTDYIDPLSSGFQISSTAPAAINANGGTFLFLAIA